MDKALNDLVNEALFQWVEITGVDLSKNRFTLGEYDLRRSTEQLNESRELDETGLTTWMMLRGLTEHYMKAQEFNAFDLIFNNAPIKKRLSSMHALHAALEHELVVDLIARFVATIRETALRHSLKDTEQLEELLADKYELAWIRLDAFLSMTRFNVHQFTQGNGDKLPIGLNPNVFEIWNVNSLIRALQVQNIPGITTVLVRDPEALHSFFVFAIKNGDNISILTDKEEEAHPAAKRMSRRPDRELQRRAAKHWFPYQLLDLKATEDGKHLYAEARTQLIPINIDAVKLAQIGELTAHEFVWLVLVAELIRDKFWKHNYHTPELSYTGEMVVEPHSLVGATGALVTTGLYKPLILPPLTEKDITSEATAAQWRRKPRYMHEWMVDRYGDKVPKDVFNVVGEAKVRLIEASHGLEQHDHWNKPVAFLEHLDPQNFGTKDRIENDRVWTARMNQIKVVQKLAEEEHKQTKDQLFGWYREQICLRREFFAEAAIRGELIGPSETLVDERDANGVVRTFGEQTLQIETRNLLYHQVEAKSYRGAFKYEYTLLNQRNGDVSLSAWDDQRRYYACYDVPQNRASYFSIFSPNCSEALAFFLGVPIAELPWQLQNWSKREPYVGNSILDRLDPVDWALENPWTKHEFKVGIAFSKRAWNARRKALGLPIVKITKAET